MPEDLPVGVVDMDNSSLSHEPLWRALRALDRVELFSPEPDGESFAPVFSFRVRGVPSEETAAALAQAGIAVRAGLHCAPAAHRAMGTLEQGTIRLAPSASSNFAEIPQVATGFLKMIHRKFSK